MSEPTKLSIRPHRTSLLGLGLGAALALVLLPSGQAMAGGSKCARASFETQLVKDACAKGGQSAAKKAMKAWVKTAKKSQAGLECKTCHSSMAPKYELEADGLALFKKLGGK